MSVIESVRLPDGTEYDIKAIADSCSPNNITSIIANLPTAISEQNLKKYGYKIGDYFERTDGARTYRYWLADMDTFYGGYDNYAILATHHIGIVVDTGATSTWNDSADISSVNYSNCTLHNYLKGTVLNNIKVDLIALFGGSTGLEHLLSHQKLTAGIGTWGWVTNQYISALTELQIYGAPMRSVDELQQGEGDKKLEIFNLYKYNRLFGNISIWLRSITDSSNACAAHADGIANRDPVTAGSYRAAGLILFH